MKPTKFRNVVLLLAFLLGVLNYLDRTAIAFFSKPIMATFSLDHAGFGMIASAFGIGYLIFTFIGGWMADSIGPRRLFGITGLIWAVSTAAIGMVSSFSSLFVARAVLGASEGPVYPGLIKAFANWMPAHKRTSAVAYAIPVSVGVAVVIGGPLASLMMSLTDEWQVMFYSLGVISLVMAAVWYSLFRNDPSECRFVNEAELRYIKSDGTGEAATGHGDDPERRHTIRVSELFLDSTLLAVYFAFFALGYFFWFPLTWLPNMLEEAYGVSIKSSALFSVLPWIAYIIGSIVSGHVSDKGVASGSLRAKKHLIWIGLIGAAIAVVPVVMFHSMTLMLVCFFFALGLVALCVPPLWALSADVVPQRPGMSSGFMDAAFALAGVLAPVISGYVLQSGLGYSAAIVLAGGITGAGALLVAFAANPDKSRAKFLKLEQGRRFEQAPTSLGRPVEA